MVLYFTASDLKFSPNLELIWNTPQFDFFSIQRQVSRFLWKSSYSSMIFNQRSKKILWNMRTMLLCFHAAWFFLTSIVHHRAHKPPWRGVIAKWNSCCIICRWASTRVEPLGFITHDMWACILACDRFMVCIRKRFCT